jgi:UPF0716 protein FxsA
MTTGAPITSSSSSSGRPRRSRLRTVLPAAVVAWLVLEIWLLTVVAGASSGLVVLLLIVAGVVLGSVVIKRAGRRAFQNLNEALNRGTAPSRGGGNGWMMLGGLLLMLPGLVSDVLGLLLLLPPVQKAVGRYAERTVDRKLRAVVPGSLGDAFQQARMHHPDGKVVPGEVVRPDTGTDPSAQDRRPPLTR